jgi:proline racemase
MRATSVQHAIEVHAEGEQGICYLGSVFAIPGNTAAEKLHHINNVDDTIRRSLCLEPRGRPQASTNIVFPSTMPEAHAGFIVMQSDRAHAMSGSNTICIVTALLETGTVPMTEPETVVVLETAAGLVRTVAECRDGRCVRVTLDGVPSFVEDLDVKLDVPGLGVVTVDIAYGGCYYVLIDADQLGVTLDRASARQVVERATAVFDAAREAVTVQHPTIPEIDFLSYPMVIGNDDPANGKLRGATVLSGRVDRSPCGTGNSARLAVMAERGFAKPGDRFVATSLIDSEFTIDHLGPSAVGDRAAVLPRISGRGFIFGQRTTVIDPADPYADGFTLTDIWG